MPQTDGPEYDDGSGLITRRKVLIGGAAGVAVVAVGGVVLLGGDDEQDEPSAAAQTETPPDAPRRGGVLRVGMLAEPASASIANPWQWSGVIGLARLGQVFEKLTEYGPEDGYAIPALATSWEPDSTGKVWNVKLREGVTFHNGKPFTADDVVYSFLKILDEKTAATPRSTLAAVLAPSGIKKRGDYELEFTLTSPYATFGNILSGQAFIVPADWKESAAEPYMPGTGPFKFKDFQPGKVTVFERNPEYWNGEKPYVDEMQFISIADESARVSGLLGGQLDVAHSVTPATIKRLEGRDDVVPFVSENGHVIKLAMATQRAPFDDLKVRQAFRLIADRPAMLEKAMSGYGFVGNDLTSPFDPMYASDIPQREQDIEQAKSLLKSAGQEGIRVTLDTSAITPGAVEAAQVFASQAKAAGVQVDVKTSPPENYFAETGPWMNTPFFVTEDGDFTMDQLGALFMHSEGPYNETQMPPPGRPYSDSWDSMIAEANSTLDEQKRKELWLEIQTIWHEEGGLIVPFFANPLDALSSKVQGLESHWRRELGFFQFQNVWLS